MRASVLERLVTGLEQGPDGCWLWSRALSKKGYGQLWVASRLRSTHVVSYELLVGPVPGGLQIDHLCRVRRCARPDHVEPVTPAVNTARAFKPPPFPSRELRPFPPIPARQCGNGHVLACDDDYYVRRSGQKDCRRCRAVGNGAEQVAS